jgi:glycine/D-amino acid oxidase-like deaminating enzyme
VLGIDQFTPPHSFGSSHGKSRIIRETYFENPLYVPLVKRADNGWVEGVEVTTISGTYAAARLVISAGPWMSELVPELALLLAIERKAVYWFDPLKAADFTPDKLPVFILARSARP